MIKKSVGRPSISSENLELIVRKLEPYLRSGKTLRKACILAQIPKSTVYKYYDVNDEFTDKIDTFSAYPSILISDNFFRRLVDISKRSKRLAELENLISSKKISKEKYLSEKVRNEITENDWSFLKWYALNSHSTREDWGRRIEVTGKDSAPVIPLEIFEPKPIETILGTYEVIKKNFLKSKNHDN